MSVLLGERGIAPVEVEVKVDKPIVEVDLDDTLLKDVNFNASRFVVRHGQILGINYDFISVYAQGRVELEEDEALYRFRQDFFGSPWHLARAIPADGAVEALEKAADLITIDVLTGRQEVLRPTLLRLLARTEMLSFIKGQVIMRPLGASYRRHKLDEAKHRQAEGAVDDDTSAIQDFSSADIFTIAIEQQKNQHLEEGPCIKKALSFRAFVNELVTYGSWEAMVKDHRNKIEIQRLARTYHLFY